MREIGRNSRVAGAALAAALMLLLAACASGPLPTPFGAVAGQLPPVPADRARIFFYRYYELYVSMGRPYIRLNGQAVAISEPGGVLYRDVAPGTYLVSVDSPGLYPDQNKTATLSGGQTIYVRVDSVRGYNSGFEAYDPDDFRVVIVDPDSAQAATSSLRYVPGPP